jgi:3-oxoadipate:acetyl-CoA acetyltransferase
VRKHCPGLIVQFSTGGRGRDPAARGLSLVHRPDMASLSTGSTNFPTIVYENPAALVLDLATQMKRFEIAPEIEIFDLSHIHGAKRLIDAGLMSSSLWVSRTHSRLTSICSTFSWARSGGSSPTRHGPRPALVASNRVMQWALGRGADAVRTGMEDNIRIDKSRLTSGNDELVRIAAALLEKHGCRPATPAEARSSLGLQTA